MEGVQGGQAQFGADGAGPQQVLGQFSATERASPGTEVVSKVLPGDPGPHGHEGHGREEAYLWRVGG